MLLLHNKSEQSLFLSGANSVKKHDCDFVISKSVVCASQVLNLL